MTQTKTDFQSNLDSYKWLYEGYEIGLFFDTLARQQPIYDKLKFNITDWDYILDRNMVVNQLQKIYHTPLTEAYGNYYWLLIIGSFKTLFSEGFEIMDKYSEFKKYIISNIWEDSYNQFNQVFRFLRNFWIHNNDPKFRIQHKHFKRDQLYVLDSKNSSKYSNWMVHFIFQKNEISKFTFLWNVNINIDFNNLQEWQDIRNICSFPEMMQLLRLFYNFCSLCWDEL
jgi:hypothetical protein